MIAKQETVVWFSPAKGRRYFTKAAAIHAEAKAKILERYPTERPESEQGRQTYPGWHFPSDDPERYGKMLRRLKRLIAKGAP